MLSRNAANRAESFRRRWLSSPRGDTSRRPRRAHWDEVCYSRLPCFETAVLTAFTLDSMPHETARHLASCFGENDVTYCIIGLPVMRPRRNSSAKPDKPMSRYPQAVVRPISR